MASIGVMFVTGGLVRFILGPRPQIFADGERFIFSVREFKAFTGLEQGIALKTSQFLTVTIAILLVAFVFYFLQKTKTGKAMRAYSDNKELALLSGIDPDKVVTVTWLLVASLTTIAGAFMVWIKDSPLNSTIYCCYLYLLQLLLVVLAHH